MELKMYVIQDGLRIKEVGVLEDGEDGVVEDIGEDIGMGGAVGEGRELIVVLLPK